MERKGSRVKVHFHKWSDRFDEWIDISESRFAPHKSFTAVNKVGRLHYTTVVLFRHIASLGECIVRAGVSQPGQQGDHG
jgi:hypothetical protein